MKERFSSDKRGFMCAMRFKECSESWAEMNNPIVQILLTKLIFLLIRMNFVCVFSPVSLSIYDLKLSRCCCHIFLLLYWTTIDTIIVVRHSSILPVCRFNFLTYISVLYQKSIRTLAHDAVPSTGVYIYIRCFSSRVRF